MSASLWDEARRSLAGLPGGGLNLAYEALDRHVLAGRGDRVAVRWVDRAGAATSTTYAELLSAASRAANALDALGVGAGETVATLLGAGPAWHTVALGTMRHRGALCPLFASLGPEAVAERLARSGAAVVVTTAARYRRSVAPVRGRLPALRFVLLVDGGTDDGSTCSLDALLAAASPVHAVPPTAPDDIALLHCTSGTTGPPKVAVHVHGAVVAHVATARAALDLGPDDVFWCTADPGWVTGTSYGLVAPLVVGATSVVDGAEFDAARWWHTLAAERVSVWYTSPTALRLLERADGEARHSIDLPHLRRVATVGEPLGAALATWGHAVFGRPIRDTWWQTETGAILLCSGDGDPPGSMGRPLPGVTAAVLRCGDDGRVAVRAGVGVGVGVGGGVSGNGNVDVVDEPGVAGELALRPDWPSRFRGYLHDEARTEAAYAHGWYLTGDVVRRDAAGCYAFVGRADDRIKSAGHLVGPWEVEQVLLAHPAVAEAGVVGAPDPAAGEVVVAVVVVRSGVAADDDLGLELVGFARARLGPALAPRRVVFAAALPRNESGKVLRRVLRDRLVVPA